MLRRLCAVVVLAASVPVVLAPSGVADLPDGGVALPGLTAHDPTITSLLLDQAHSHLLVAASGGIDVLAADGSGAATHVPSPAEVGGMALNSDESTVWYSAPA